MSTSTSREGRRARLDPEGLAALSLSAAKIAGPILVNPRARASLARLPATFDRRFSWVMFECRLRRSARVDVILHVEQPMRGGLMHACPPHWSTARRTFRKWCDRRSPLAQVETMTVEMDGVGSTWSAPLVFAALERASGQRPPPAMHAVIPALLAAAGEQAPRALAPALARLPAQGWPLHVASLFPRGVPAARLVVSLPPGLVTNYLESLSWRGAASEVGRLAERIGNAVGAISLHLDLADEIGSEVGLEILYPGSPARDSRWRATLDLIEPLAPRKVEALAAWPRRDAPLVRLLGIKLVVGPASRLAAKAYLAFRAAPAT